MLWKYVMLTLAITELVWHIHACNFFHLYAIYQTNASNKRKNDCIFLINIVAWDLVLSDGDRRGSDDAPKTL